MRLAAACLVANEGAPVQIRLGALTTVPNNGSLQTLLTLFPKETLSNSLLTLLVSNAFVTCTVGNQDVDQPGVVAWSGSTRTQVQILPS